MASTACAQLRSGGIAVALVLLGACASPDLTPRDSGAAADAALRDCAAWIDTVDAAVDAAGVRDAGTTRIPGYPGLRLDRFTASFARKAASDPQAFDAWLARAQALDRDARRAELSNLPPDALGLSRDAAAARTAACTAQLGAQALASAAARQTLLENAVVPDDYVGWQRVLGLYPITRIPFSAGIDEWQADTVAAFRANRTNPDRHAVRRYAPPTGAPLDAAGVAALLVRTPRDALGVPRLAPDEIDRLFATFAPVFEIETTGPYDRPGALAWGDALLPQVDAARPTVYRRLAFTRDGDEVLVQLVYTIWFSERPGNDILAGKLDGLVWRVTLAPRGAPLVYDSIHPCGCFHMFFPTARVRVNPAPDPEIEWAFVPQALPAIAPGERLALRLATRTHYLVGVAPDAGGAVTPAATADEDSLRTLPLPGGGTRSLYGPDGLVAGSERPERALFWPMGIVSAGAMRQWGRHATAFVGRRHFDDADLIEQRFRIVSPKP